MATVLQTHGGTSGFANNYTLTLPSPVTAGSSLLVFGIDELAQNVNSLTLDSVEMDIEWQGGVNNTRRIGVLRNLSGGQDEIRIAGTTVTRFALIAVEFDDLGPIDDDSGSWGATAAGDSTSHSLPFTAGGDDYVAIGIQYTGNTPTVTPTGDASVVLAGSAPQASYLFYRTGVPSGAGTITWSLSPSALQTGAAVTFVGSNSPIISSVTPSTVGTTTATLTIAGSNFTGTEGTVTVSQTTDPEHASAFNLPIQSWSDTSIVVQNRTAALGAGTRQIFVNDSAAFAFTVSPFVTSNVPSEGILTLETGIPLLYYISAQSVTDTTLTVRVNTNQAGTVYLVITSSATQPSAAQIVAGQNHTGAAALFADSQVVESAGQVNIPVTGLTASTTYYAHLVQQ